MNKLRTAIFPVGGLGTRFLPATKSMPKEMMPIANKPLIQYAFEEARDAGIEKFIFITGRNKNAINNHFDHAYELESKLDENKKSNELSQVLGWMPEAGQIAFVRQQKPLGLGHAVWCARNFIGQDEPFVVTLADELLMTDKNSKENFLKKMINFYQTKSPDSSVIAVDEIANEDTKKYGIIKPQNQNQIIDMIEKPNPVDAPSNLAITGRYILNSKIFKYLEKFEIGSGGEIQLTDAMRSMCKDHSFYYQKIDETRFDCGNVIGYLEANIAFAMQDQKNQTQIKNILKKYL